MLLFNIATLFFSGTSNNFYTSFHSRNCPFREWSEINLARYVGFLFVYVGRWLEKIISKHSLIKLNCSWSKKLILWTLNRQAELLLPTIIFIIFWNFLMLYQFILSPEVTRCAIITYDLWAWYIRVALRVSERLKT